MNRLYELPPFLSADLEKFREIYLAYMDGKADNTAFKANRVPFGIYEQRTRDTFMVRAKLPGGIVSVQQLATLAELAEKFGDGRLHVTTRAGAQIHGVMIGDFIEVIEVLHAAGLTNRGGGGNTVRNITASPLAGAAKGELFDVTPHLIALNIKMLERKDSYNLPRKYKIAFSGNPEDTFDSEVTDLGFAAKIENGVKGFRVFIGGGMGGKSRVGVPFREFLPEGEVFLLAEAVKEVFCEHGNRRDKTAARLRFLLEQIGLEKLKSLTDSKYGELKESIEWEMPLKSIPELLPIDDGIPDLNSEEKLWWERFVIPQKEAGYFAVKVPLYLGDINSAHLKELSCALSYREGESVRFGTDQNIYLRNLKASEAVLLYPLLKKLSPLVARAAIIGDISVCAGAGTCQLGITNSRGAFKAIEKKLAALQLNGSLDDLSGLKINISGCPNSCGRHLTADIGFYGKAKREGNVSYPAYGVVAGAGNKSGKAEFAANMGDISAFHLAAFTADILSVWQEAKGQESDFTAWVDNGGGERIREISLKYLQIPPFEEDKNPYYDLYSNEIFSLKGRGTGECSAGIYDLLEADKTALEKALQSGRSAGELSLIRLLAARMLIVTRGEDVREENEVFSAFKRYFIDTALVAPEFAPLLEGAAEIGVVKLADAVLKLYSTMDNTLKFAGERIAAKEEAIKPEKAAPVIDLRGVACPMNFVKTKVELAKIKSGDEIEVYLDDGAPIENVPRSAAAEGHTVGEQIDEGGYWSVKIKKK
ncbi:MAG: sulfurtransferase TusA family protein [Deferribacteraceae bacterium]|jgi:sulfite reductase (ferredoxin)|nr:sulfurtransferase TusA family protein [Deferribacteraceae bacterium]